MQSLWTGDKGPICQSCWIEKFAEETPTEASLLRRTIELLRYNHRCERERMARVIRRLVRYADRVAERHPKAVTISGQNARVVGGMWLAEFDRQNVKGDASAVETPVQQGGFSPSHPPACVCPAWARCKWGASPL